MSDEVRRGDPTGAPAKGVGMAAPGLPGIFSSPNSSLDFIGACLGSGAEAPGERSIRGASSEGRVSAAEGDSLLGVAANRKETNEK